MASAPDQQVNTTAADEPWAEFRASLLGDGVLLATGVDGIYGRSAAYESVVEAIDRLILRVGADQEALSVRFPPVMPWSTFQKSGYLESFPDQMGSVDRHSAATNACTPSSSTAPRPVRIVGPCSRPPISLSAPRSAIRSTRPSPGSCPKAVGGSRSTDTASGYEPSTDPFRMQSFRQHDYVYLGTPKGARAHRDEWIGRGLEVLRNARSGSGVGSGERPVLRPLRSDAGGQSAVRRS